MAHPLETVELTPTPGVSIMADVMAGSSPAYVYLHGMSSTRSSEKSDALYERARSRGRAFARFDFRGHGDSSGSMTDLTLTELIEDTTTVLRHMGPCLLVGSSLGGHRHNNFRVDKFTGVDAKVAAIADINQDVDFHAFFVVSPELADRPQGIFPRIEVSAGGGILTNIYRRGWQ